MKSAGAEELSSILEGILMERDEKQSEKPMTNLERYGHLAAAGY